MIDFLRGKIVHAEPEYIVLDVGGVGYRIYCANPGAFGEPGNGGETTVYVHHHVREDAIQLYGFSSRSEQTLFRRLIGVTGIGPKVAIGAMSGGRPEALIAAIWREDIGYLTKLPGIGKKTAQRIILDLRDKLGQPSDEAGGDWAAPEAAAGKTQDAAAESVAEQAREGLRSLGFTDAEIDRIWPKAIAGAEGGESADALMKAALKHLYRG